MNFNLYENNKISKFKNDIVSVTGTNGKTTTLKMIYDILSNYTTVNKTHKNSNSKLGIPWCIHNYFDLNSKYWLIEIGINKPNEMDMLVKMVKPNIRILSSIGIAHNLNFKSDEDYFNEKLKFVENDLNDNTVIILNNYNIIIKKYHNTIKNKNKNIKILTCGNSYYDDVRLIKQTINSNNISSYAEILTKNGIIKVNYNGISTHTAINMCLAVTFAIYINVPLDIIQTNLNNFNLYQHRGKIIVKQKFILYDYSYNGNLSSISANLKDFQKIKSNNKLIILGDLNEIINSIDYSKDIIKLSLQITRNIATESNIYNEILKTYSNNYNRHLNLNNLNNLKQNISDYIKKQQNMVYIFIQGSNKSNMIEIAEYLENNY